MGARGRGGAMGTRNRIRSSPWWQIRSTTVEKGQSSHGSPGARVRRWAEGQDGGREQGQEGRSACRREIVSGIARLARRRGEDCERDCERRKIAIPMEGRFSPFVSFLSMQNNLLSVGAALIAVKYTQDKALLAGDDTFRRTSGLHPTPPMGRKP